MGHFNITFEKKKKKKSVFKGTLPFVSASAAQTADSYFEEMYAKLNFQSMSTSLLLTGASSGYSV